MMDNLTPEMLSDAEHTLEAKGYVNLDISGDFPQEKQALGELLQNALIIEHATIPIYLMMLYTIPPDTDWEVQESIRSVVVEEMLHFSLVGNLLNAIGIEPEIYVPGFIPNYPARLPSHVGDKPVELFSFSKAAVDQGREIEKATYMRADRVLLGPAEMRADYVAGSDDSSYDITIGEFYAHVESKLRAIVKKFGEESLFGNEQTRCKRRNRQILPDRFYYNGGGGLIEVFNFATAEKAISLIKDQGEGAHDTLYTEDGTELAHYFRFDEIYCSRLYQRGDTFDNGPSGKSINVPWDKARQTVSGLKVGDYPPGDLRNAIEAFNRRYSQLLCVLQAAFNGKPDLLINAVIGMCSLRDDFEVITRNPFPGKEGENCFAAPTFEFVEGLSIT